MVVNSNEITHAIIKKSVGLLTNFHELDLKNGIHRVVNLYEH